MNFDRNGQVSFRTSENVCMHAHGCSRLLVSQYVVIICIALAKQGDNQLGTVASVCLSVLSCLNCLTYGLDFWTQGKCKKRPHTVFAMKKRGKSVYSVSRIPIICGL